MRWTAALIALVACAEPAAPPARADVVGGMWVVQLPGAIVCFSEDPYRIPDLDTAEEAIAACRARQDSLDAAAAALGRTAPPP